MHVTTTPCISTGRCLACMAVSGCICYFQLGRLTIRRWRWQLSTLSWFVQGGYDLKIGTSERGSTETADKLELRPFTHAIIVLGGPQGLEQCLSLDANAQGADVSKLFDFWLNTCAGQGSRTIRTEEALLISLTYLQPALMNCALRQ